jgi:large exoprotein involved in heme utilization and adhesion
LTVVNNAQIGTNTFGAGNAGDITVTAGALGIVNGGSISSVATGPGKGGRVDVTVDRQLTITGKEISAAGFTGISTEAAGVETGDAGSIIINAGSLSITRAGMITSSTFGPGRGGSVSVTVDGQLNINGAVSLAALTTLARFFTPSEAALQTLTGIITDSAAGSTGNAGDVTVKAGALSIVNSGEISSSTRGPAGSLLDPSNIRRASTGNAGSVTVSAGKLSLLSNGRILVSTQGPGAGGDVTVAVAGPVALSSGGLITAGTGEAGAGGSVRVIAQGPLSLSDPGSGIIASAASTATGNAGSVTVAAPQITLKSGAEIASTTAGIGAGGEVDVTTSGALVLDGAGVANTGITASATGLQSGPGGLVTVRAGALTVEGGAQIASSTAGPGTGGDVNITVASDIVLPDLGPQITAQSTAQSTGGGDAGSITISARRLLMNDSAAITTEALASTANGGNITLHVRDFLHLVASEISTSVKGETGNGGNIAIDPQLVILDHSSIIAQAIAGHGGNITISADQFIPSSDSIISASSQNGVSGTVVTNGLVNANGALVVLSTQLRGRTEVLREACAARAGRPMSTLVGAGRGGLPSDPEATLPALYIAGRDLNPNLQTSVDAAEPSGTPLHTTARLTMRCG